MRQIDEIILSFIFFLVVCEAVAGGVEPNPASAAKPLPLRELMDTPLRDPSICQGPDGTWYLTGTPPPFWDYNHRYYLSCSEVNDGRYNCMTATATNIYGPDGERYESIPHGGHKVFFEDRKGQWWFTFFGSDDTAPWRERPGILPIEFDGQGRIHPGD